MLEVREVAGKGRGVFASRPIASGEVVLRELPLLLYPQQGTAAAFCSHCLRAFNSLEENAASVVPCAGCGRVGFCGTACAAAAAADPGSHCPAVCSLLAACNMAGLTDDQQSALQFLFRCCSLRAAAAGGDAAAAARLSAIVSLAAPTPLLPAHDSDANGDHSGGLGSWSSGSVELRELHGRLSHALAAVGAAPAAAPTLEEVAELLRRDATNGYGIMAPSAPDGERRIRGTGLYAHASLINHECLPNVARFDRFDRALTASSAAPAAANAEVEFRALHDIPAGEEVTQSYFPLPWPLSERQQRCRQDYGFECACPRCKEEATWSEEESEWETDEDAGMADAAAAAAAAATASAAAAGGSGEQEAAAPADGACSRMRQEQQQGEQQQGANPAYISLFLLKYVCPREGCYGTLAPLMPAQQAQQAAQQQRAGSSHGGIGAGGSTVFECNMCGGQRTEAEFLAELEAAE